MNKTLLCAALAGIVSVSMGSAVQAGTMPEKEKCFGIAMAGKNDCKSADGAHSCAGHATTDKSANEWKFVPKGECEGMGGSLTPGKTEAE